jgi:hypothetical protein
MPIFQLERKRAGLHWPGALSIDVIVGGRRSRAQHPAV